MGPSACTHLDKNDLAALFKGACFLASGGGGPANVADRFLATFEGTIALVSPDAVPADASAAVVSAIGSPEAISSGNVSFTYAPVSCLVQLEAAIGSRVSYVIPFEIGTCGLLTPVICADGADGDRYLVDGDGNGRAVPEMILSTFAKSKVTISPFCFSNDAPPDSQTSCVGTLDYATVDATSSAIRRLIAATEFGEIGALAAWAMSGGQVGEVTLAGTVTLALRLGRVIEAQHSLAAVLDLIKSTGGYARVLGTGTVQSYTSTTNAQGFDMDLAVFDCGDHILSNVAQNENLLAWDSRFSQPVAMAPDLICYLSDEGAPLSNTEIADNQPYWRQHAIHIVALRANSKIREAKLLNRYLEMLANLGYRGPFLPVESTQVT